MGARPLDSLIFAAIALAVLFGAAWIVLRKTTCVRMRMMVLGVIVSVMASALPTDNVLTTEREHASVGDSDSLLVTTTRSMLSRVGFLLVLGGVFATVAQKREETETADA